jgi:serine protease
MKPKFIKSVLFITAVCLSQAYAQKVHKQAPAQYKPNTVIIKVLPQYRIACQTEKINDAALQLVFTELGMARVNKKFVNHSRPETEYNAQQQPLVDLSLIYQLQYTSKVTVHQAIKKLMATGKLQYADPHYIYKTSYTPNDPSLNSQYFFSNINAYNAWDIQKGDTNVVVGIVDSGSDPDHPDLAANLKHNYADPINGIDDDADGYIDNFSGWDVSENDNNTTVGAEPHGSHVSGCAAAVTDNNIGVAGIGFNCKFLPVKSSYDASSGSIDNGYEGIVYAADHGANIINCSWGGAGGSSFGQDVINYAVYNKNVTMMCSAGNANTEDINYPAGYANVFSIASTNSADGKSSFSSYGATIDMCAPGSGIMSTVFNNSYTQMSGTSMASPIAAGCAALVKSQFPTYTGQQVGELLRVTCDNIYSVGNNGNYLNKLGTGRINLFEALTNNSSPSVRFTHQYATDNNDNTFVNGDTVRLSGVHKNFLAATTNLTATLSTTNPIVTVLNGTINLGVINTLDSANNASNPFTFKINASAGLNAKVQFKLTYNDGTYSDIELIIMTVNVDYINFSVNKIATTVTSKGRIGYNNDNYADGQGFMYDGENLMYDGGLMISNSSNAVSDVIRGVGAGNDADFQSVNRIQQLIPAATSNFDTYGLMNDVSSTTPLNIQVRHKSFAWSNAPDDKYVIVEYTIKNTSTSAINSLHAGLCFDWDIMDYSQNRSAENAALRLGYSFSTQVSGLYAGVKVLTSGGFNHYAIDNIAGGNGGLDISGGFTTAGKFTTLTTQRPAAGVNGTGNDVIDVVATGPYNIPAGDSIKVAFAILAGNELMDLENSANNAQIKYDGLTAITTSENTLPLQIMPNPANTKVTIGFTNINTTPIAIKVFNSNGVQVLNIENVYTKGYQSVQLNTSQLSNGVYFVSLQQDHKVTTSKFTVIQH